MSDQWMINTGGRAVKVDEGEVQLRRQQDWKIYPLDRIKDGEPIIKYFPQYDMRSGSRVTEYVDFDDTAEILVVEIV